MSIPTIPDSTILHHTAPTVFQRGKDYYRRGAVGDLSLRGGTLHADVEGSEYEPYRVQVAYDTAGITGATCTCAYEGVGWCKHIVATLLAARAAPDEIAVRPPLEELLAPLDRDQLQRLVLTLAERLPDVADMLEAQIMLLQPATTIVQAEAAGTSRRRTPVDPKPFRRQAQAIMVAVHGMRSGMEIYGYTSSAVEGIRQLAQQARTFTENGDGYSALAILDAVTEEYVEHWFEFDDSDGEAGALFEELGEIWAEALLTADLTSAERHQWATKLENWQDEAEEYGVDVGFQVAVAAGRQGWDDPVLQRVLQGDTAAWQQGTTGEADAEEDEDWDEDGEEWEDEDWDEDGEDSAEHWYAEELITVRLNVLERQERWQEYLYLAQATGQMQRYVTMLAQQGRIAEAVEQGLHYLPTARGALALATALRDQQELDAALRVAEHGLRLEEPRAELASWLCHLARGLGKPELALRAAEVAFRSSPTLSTYHTVGELAGADWETKRPALLEHLRKAAQMWLHSTPAVEIFLTEGLIDDAIAVVDRGGAYSLVDAVMDAAILQRPGWVVQAGKARAEEIMNAGKAERYDQAVDWLEKVRRAYEVLGESDTWQAYVEEVRKRHGRKHKLMGLMKRL